MNGLAGCYVSTIGKPHENFDLTRCSGGTPSRPARQSWVCLCFWTRRALAESIIGLYKTEVTRRRGPWRGPEDVEFATLEWVHWYNTQRLLEPIGNVAPVVCGASAIKCW